MAADSSDNNSAYVFDPESVAEVVRRLNVDRVTTKAMGGVFGGLAESDIAGLHNVLDLACGPGGWVLDVAFEHPTIEVAGVDISRSMIDYANARARTQNLLNAFFGVMDLSQPLDFSDDTFDLVNARFLSGMLLKEKWESLITECTRILRQGGILRLTEAVDATVSNSPALERLKSMLYQALWRAGIGFSVDGNTFGMAYMLPRLLRRANYRDIQIHAFALEVSAETEHWTDSYRHNEIMYYQSIPFLVKFGVTTQEEAERLYQQMLIEMNGSDFCSMWNLVAVHGYKSEM